MSDLVALVGFSIVSSVTPGPNNVMLWASGIQFGFRATLPHVIGTSIGIGTMAIAVAAGIGVLVTTVPQGELTLKLIGSLYLLYLAYQPAVRPSRKPRSHGRSTWDKLQLSNTSIPKPGCSSLPPSLPFGHPNSRSSSGARSWP